MLSRSWRSMVVLLLGWAALTGASAAAYRCQGADGKVSYSDRPCEVGQQVAGKVDSSGVRVPARAESAASAAAAAAAALAASAAASQAASSRVAAPATAKR